jgi:hypothetical protein
MESEGSLRLHKNPPLVPILSQIDPVHTIPSSLRFILILSPYVLVFLVVAFLLAFPPISYKHSSSPHSCYMPCSSHSPWLDHSNYIWRGVQVMKLLIMQLPPICHQLSLYQISWYKIYFPRICLSTSYIFHQTEYHQIISMQIVYPYTWLFIPVYWKCSPL